MKPASANALKLTAAALMLGLAGMLFWRFIQAGDGTSERAFFYDLSERKLYVADRSLIPPIRGMNDAVEDGVRAVVVSLSGRPEDKATWTIAYLETCSPELKQALTEARATGTASSISRTAAQAHRLVRRPGDPDWVSLATPEGERIVSEWATAGTGDAAPAVCSP